MSIIASTSPAAAEPWTPKWLEGQAGAPVFFLRAGDVIERELFEAQLAGPAWGAAEAWPWEKQGALLEGLRTLGGEDAPHLIALAETAGAGALEDAGEIALLKDAAALVAQHYPPYRVILEQEARRQAVLPVAAFCRWCVRWENVPEAGEPRRDVAGLIDPASIGEIPALLLRSAGVEAYRRQYGASARKNSDAPLKSGADPRISPSAEPSDPDGSSTESDTPKIPA